MDLDTRIYLLTPSVAPSLHCIRGCQRRISRPQHPPFQRVRLEYSLTEKGQDQSSQSYSLRCINTPQKMLYETEKL
ncbi:hypothetical protein FOXYSP1_13826 [Fusarium oxysporum f. sp. phaseoli]